MPSIKNIIIFVTIGLSMVLVYVFFIKSNDEETNLVSGTSVPIVGNTTSNQATTQVGQDFLTLLLNVKNIKLDASIFSDPVFISLLDSSIILIPDGNEGRPNPFAPIGVDIVAIPPAATPPASTDDTTTVPPPASGEMPPPAN